jgi:hypothetical protein
MKAYARVRAVCRTPPAAAAFEVEYTLLVGAQRSDCVALTPNSYISESSLVASLKSQLRSHLNAKYAPETFTTSDIVLFGG